MEVGKPHGLSIELIQIRSLENRIPVTGQIAVTLIVSHHEDDVGPVTGDRGLRLESDCCQKDQRCRTNGVVHVGDDSVCE